MNYDTLKKNTSTNHEERYAFRNTNAPYLPSIRKNIFLAHCVNVVFQVAREQIFHSMLNKQKPFVCHQFFIANTWSRYK